MHILREKIFIIALLLLSTLIAVFFSVSPTAHAAPVSGFNPGLIIDDGVFTNSGSMSASDIQQFLSSKVPICDTNGIQPNSYTQKTFTCLKDYQENGKLASQIIYDTSQQYLVNPQVLIVLLQKEQSLVTDTWPSNSQYTSAAGYSCPDSTPGVCDSQYYGFTNQVQWAAKMYHAIITSNPAWFTPYVLGNNKIYYNPGPYNNTTKQYYGSFANRPDIEYCGSSVVNIQSKATQALYNYTPYQPNQSSLDAGWGQAPPCGAYGNRNFFEYFTSWFGSTTSLYTWSTISQNAYYDESKTLPVNMGTLAAGERYYLTVSLKNTGNTTWTRNGVNPVNLGTSDTHDRASPFCDATWVNASPSCNRVASLKEYTVAPGQIGSFEFWITAPSTGSYNESYLPVFEGKTWMQSPSAVFDMGVTPYTWIAGNQTIFTNSTKTNIADPNALKPNTRYYVTIGIKNTGSAVWQKLGSNPASLGTSGPRDRMTQVCDISTWAGCNRAATIHEYSIAPGQAGSYEFWITTPATLGSYTENFTPLIEAQNWMGTNNITLLVKTQ
jgi:hypothetical protein